jgi:hypothetical protein
LRQRVAEAFLPDSVRQLREEHVAGAQLHYLPHPLIEAHRVGPQVPDICPPPSDYTYRVAPTLCGCPGQEENGGEPT